MRHNVARFPCTCSVNLSGALRAQGGGHSRHAMSLCYTMRSEVRCRGQRVGRLWGNARVPSQSVLWNICSAQKLLWLVVCRFKANSCSCVELMWTARRSLCGTLRRTSCQTLRFMLRGPIDRVLRYVAPLIVPTSYRWSYPTSEVRYFVPPIVPTSYCRLYLFLDIFTWHMKKTLPVFSSVVGQVVFCRFSSLFFSANGLETSGDCQWVSRWGLILSVKSNSKWTKDKHSWEEFQVLPWSDRWRLCVCWMRAGGAAGCRAETGPLECHAAVALGRPCRTPAEGTGGRWWADGCLSCLVYIQYLQHVNPSSGQMAAAGQECSSTRIRYSGGGPRSATTGSWGDGWSTSKRNSSSWARLWQKECGTCDMFPDEVRAERERRSRSWSGFVRRGGASCWIGSKQEVESLWPDMTPAILELEGDGGNKRWYFILKRSWFQRSKVKDAAVLCGHTMGHSGAGSVTRSPRRLGLWWPMSRQETTHWTASDGRCGLQLADVRSRSSFHVHSPSTIKRPVTVVSLLQLTSFNPL